MNKKIHWNDIMKVYDANKDISKTNYHLSVYIDKYFSSPNPTQENYTYWHDKFTTMNQLELFFSSNSLKRYKVSENNPRNHAEIFLKSTSNYSDIIDFSGITPVKFIKDYQKLIKNKVYSFPSSTFKDLDLNILLKNHPSIDDFLELCSLHAFSFNISAENLYTVFEYLLAPNSNLEEWNNFSRLVSLMRYLENNLSEMFNLYLSKKEQDPSNSLHDTIFAECLHICYSSNFVSHSSFQHLSFFANIHENNHHFPSLYKLSSIKTKFPKKEYSYLATKNDNHVEIINDYKNSLSEPEKLEFYKKFPICLLLLEEENFKFIQDLAHNYYDNFEYKYKEYYNSLSDKKQTSIEEHQIMSKKFFLATFGENITINHLSKFSDENLIELFKNNSLSIYSDTKFKIPKNKIIKKFVINNINESYTVIPYLLFKYINERIDPNKPSELFDKLNLNTNIHYSLMNRLNETETHMGVFDKKFAKKYKLAHQNIVDYIEDETKDLSLLLKQMSIDYILPLSFLNEFSTLKLDARFNLKDFSIPIDYQDLYSPNVTRTSEYIFSVYQNITDPIFLRYQEVFSYLLENKSIFLGSNFTSYSSQYSSKNIHEVFDDNLEMICCKFHLLQELYHGYNYITTVDEKKTPNSFFALKSPFEKLSSSYLPAPSGIYALFNKEHAPVEKIFNEYNKVIRGINLQSILPEKKETPVKKKI